MLRSLGVAKYVTAFIECSTKARYSNPNGSLGDGNFGRITSILALTERTIRFGGRVLF